jgi:lipopolysaccharide transport system permease protein
LDYFRRLLRLRFFLLALVRNDLNNRYRRSMLGIAWSLARPVGMTTVLCVVFSGTFGTDFRDYAPFLFLGFAIWQFLLDSMLGGCMTFFQGATYIRQQPMPLLLFPLRSVLVSGFHTGVALLLAMGLTCLWVGVPPLIAVLSVVPGLVLIFLLALSFATLCGALHTRFPDTQHMLEIVLQAAFYLTPVLYRPDAFANNPTITRIIALNPFTSVLELIRRPLLSGEFATAGNWAMASAFLAAIGVGAWLVLRRMQRELVFWV